MSNPTVPNGLNHVMADLIKRGAKPLLVGGAVRDHLLGETPKDYDIEVYNIDPINLETVLSAYGKVDKVGVSFGVIKLYINGKDYDFSLPRRDNKVGVGHKGFLVEYDPSMTPREACGRRDYTINSIAYDLTTDTLLDFYGGQDDLETRVLRHTTEAFSEDPLRVLRGFQIASRFGMTVAPETAALCASIRDTHKTLAKERIWGEWEKWAKKGKDLQLGLEFLYKTRWIENYPELAKRPTYYWKSLNRVLYGSNSENEGERIIQIFVALCKGMSELNTASFLKDLGLQSNLVEKCSIIQGALCDVGRVSTDSQIRRLAVRIHPATIEQVIFAKSYELPLYDLVNLGYLSLINKAKGLDVFNKKPLPILTGKHLMKLGVAPGPSMGKIIKDAYEAQLDGVITNLEEGLSYYTKTLGT